MNGTDSSLFATGVYGIVKTVCCSVFLLFIADSLGRRRSLLWTSPALFVVLFIIGIYGRVQPPVTGEPVCYGHSPVWHMAVLTLLRYLHLAMLQLLVFTSGQGM